MRYAIIVLGLIGGLVAVSGAEASAPVGAGGVYRPGYVSPLSAVAYRRRTTVVRRGAVGYRGGVAVSGGTVGYTTGGTAGYGGATVVRRGAVGYRGRAAVRRGRR
jgi:hypothetical protein